MKYVEIKNVGFDNKGAELMLRTLCKELNGFNLVITPNTRLHYDDFSKLGLKMRLDLPRGRILNIEKLTRFLPKRICSRIGVVNWNQIDTILDCSGLAYSDSWGCKDAEETLKLFKSAKKVNKTIIMLPQAYGPFRDEKLQKIMKQIFDLADIVYVRDNVSLGHCQSISDRNFIFSEDFTNIYHTSENAITPQENNYFTFIPNWRLVDKGQLSSEQLYSMISDAAEVAIANNLKFRIVFHEGQDYTILNQELKIKGFEVFYSNDIRKLINALLESKCAVSARYHAVATLLSNNIPTLALSWSHKYRELLDIYDLPNFCLTNYSQVEYKQLCQDIIDYADNNKMAQTLIESSRAYKHRTNVFFDDLKTKI